MHHERFRSGALTTAFIDEEFPEGFSGAEISDERGQHLAAIASFMHTKMAARAAQTDQILQGHAFHAPDELIVQFDERVFETVSAPNGVQVDGKAIDLESSWKPGDLFFYGYVDGNPTSLSVDMLAEGSALPVAVHVLNWLCAVGGLKNLWLICRKKRIRPPTRHWFAQCRAC